MTHAEDDDQSKPVDYYLIGHYGLACLADSAATALGITGDKARLDNLYRALLAAYRRGRRGL